MDDSAQQPHDLAPLPAPNAPPDAVPDATEATDVTDAPTPALEPEPLVPRELEPRALAKALHVLAERIEAGVTANVALVDRMHGDLERQKGDLLGRALSPLLYEIVGLHDQVLDVMDSLQ